MNSYAYWSQIVNLNERNFRPKANAENLKSLIIPDCPENVQDEAVKLAQGQLVSGHESLSEAIEQTLLEYNKVQEVSQRIDEQEQLTTQLQQAILQDAVQGRLTAHWRTQTAPTETGPALLSRIRAEKADLIRQGKLRKENPLPPITEAEKPFELPKGWVWARLGEVAILERGKSKHRPRNDARLFQNGKYPFIQTGDVARSKFSEYQIKSCDSFYSEFGLAQSKVWPSGTLCITIAANIAETGFLTFSACFPDSVVGFTPLIGTYLSQFVRYFIQVSKSDITRFAPATAQKNINLGILDELFFPLPPLSEQQAIVEAVERALGQVAGLRAELGAQRAGAGELLRALLHRAFAGGEEVEGVADV